ncbi:MAG TPA: phosphoribosylaminoimidazolesuccinocarboxamide synthase [Pyrinomonadaceae bacterium]|jgi:phosphoribosylaminoimidazole-succinocarboxamide synthase|nr:phosphoribosylaminoimidazolesuccinocarboxamide synthase [Pyrinomonadaceae bacterium]
MAITKTDLPGMKLHGRGKVRDIYDLGEHFLIVATDRLSAFDVVLPTPIPHKGKVLTQMSAFWFDHFKNVVPNHVVSTDVDNYPRDLHEFRDQLEGRSMLVKKAKVFPIECVARGYLTGSGLKDYNKTGSVCGIPLPAGLRESDRLPQPIFTPSTKAEKGHDENISEERAAKVIGKDNIGRLKELTLSIYGRGVEYASTRGIIICDTKFEFGLIDGEIAIVDEMLTPDSSRFWPADQYSPGRPQPSFDKQFVRDYLEKIGWNKQPPAPELPEEIVKATSAKYVEALRLLTGRDLQ